MQKFVNNWSAQVSLALGATSLALGLPDGEYRLTLSDALGLDATRWEIVRAVVVGGVGTLQRGREGTTAQAWPAGSFIYCALTAGFLSSLQQQLAELTARVAALETGGGLVDENGTALVDEEDSPLI
ncbi:hypothetical protein ACRS3X_17065 [Ectopseudomonas hydrolytica]|uniref:hypothetical protein n=1 Tax=Ectopseudomonas hydrolytica TaxID=2493633 RepID=UPI003EE2BC11